MGRARRHFLQQLVARVVAEGVVDVLEAVQVDEQHREIAAIAARVLDREVEHVAEHGPVRKRRQGVVIGQELDALLVQLAL